MDTMKYGKFPTLNNQNGFGYVYLLILVPIILVIMGSAASYFNNKLVTNVRLRAKESFSIHQQNMLTDLDNPIVWSETIRLNPDLSCLSTGTCHTLQKQSFIVYGMSGKALSGTGSTGYQLDGRACAGADEECPIKWMFEWRPMCEVLVGCPSDSEVEMVGRLVEVGESSPLNLEVFKIVRYQKLF